MPSGPSPPGPPPPPLIRAFEGGFGLIGASNTDVDISGMVFTCQDSAAEQVTPPPAHPLAFASHVADAV